MKKIILAIVLCLPSVALLLAAELKNGGFSGVRVILFDESGGQQPPQIPKSWRFVGVGNGEKTNETSLWFQDNNGTIYAVTGFHENWHFIMHPYVYRMEGTPDNLSGLSVR
jgi:hypothetical protein